MKQCNDVSTAESVEGVCGCEIGKAFESKDGIRYFAHTTVKASITTS